MNASRVAWIVANGDPGEINVLHRCSGGSGSSGCINTRHLYLGRDAQNHRDMVEADRTPHGESHPMAVLNEDLVKAIRERRAAGVSASALAAEFEISVRQVYRVVMRENWVRVA
jgi:ribosome-binding protein aMBF1 (putative translation factor)